jgi:hypothetical protein
MSGSAEGRMGKAQRPWAVRVSQEQIRRLYTSFASGIYDDELLLEVGWGLHARCTDVMAVVSAVRGEVPCPECGESVYRSTHEYYARLRERPSPAQHLTCPACRARITWGHCRDALRDHPLCFVCRSSLQWDYQADRLACIPCGKTWSWQQYRASVSRRKWLPCPRCSALVQRPERARHGAGRPADPTRADEAIACPRCEGAALHTEGKIRCSHCGYEQKWAIYRKRIKRRAERLECTACGHAFTWGTWRRRYQGLPIFTGNPAPVEEFVGKWPGCATPEQQLIQIDTLLHALHGQGAMAPLFVEGSAESVMAVLNELAQQR